MRNSSADPRRIAFVFLAVLAALAASGLAAASAADTGKARKIGADACLVCHSDRPEMGTFSHRARTEDLGGCEACHGPGSAHALAHGDPALILNPRKAEPEKADRSCLVCHAAQAAPAHFTPSPGKAKCADCHTIHAPAPAAVPSAEETPGRPPFALDLGAEAPAPAAARPLPLGILPALPESARTVRGWRTTGEARLGWRFVNVTGNERVYDQDSGLDDGFRLFDLSVDAQSADRPDDRLRFEASGMCDPLETYALTMQRGLDWELTADLKRLNSVYRATGDPRDHTAHREELSTAITFFPQADLRFTLGFDMGRRDGRWLSARYVPGGIPADREPFDETTRYFHARTDYATDRLSLSFAFGWRIDRIDSEIRTLPVLPASLRYDEETRADGPVATILASWDASDKLMVDGKFVASDLDSDTRGRGAFEDEDLTLTRDNVDGERTWLRGEIGATWFATEEFSFAARVAGTSDDADSSTRMVEEEYDSPFDPPAVSTDRTSWSRDQDRVRLTTEGNWRPSDIVAFRLGYEWLWEEFDECHEGDDGQSDSGQSRGFLAGVDLDPAEDLSIEGLYRFVAVDEPFAPIGTEDEDQERLKVRYSGVEDLDLSAFLSHRLTTNRLHDTEIFAWVTGITAGLRPVEDLTISATVDWQSFDTQTDAVRYYDNVPTTGRAEFDGEATGFTLDLGFRPIPEMALTAGGSLYFARGDYDYDWYQFWLGASYDVAEWLTIGADGKVRIYDDHLVSFDDYKGWILELWFRFRF